MNIRFAASAGIAASAILLSACAGMSGPKPIAVADLKPTQGNNAGGTVSFIQKGDQILVDARIDGLAPGQHGFHVHEKGDCSAPDGMSAGGHFNPGSMNHGGPSHDNHHAGDLGNVEADGSGKANLQVTLPGKQVSMKEGDANSIIGKALIVHADPDDYKTQPTGNSGKRVACGVVKPV
ncbi:superoxide dismutase family protein [Noviherbaspirillum galbum]|uniref:Superoxide dismutase [Cu-Zn] n=1 Tax=Noviherbaspirillum galbum TaxID=2709383 RepID=A0A6B3SW68_9BURK|nr:superoxide dismutase family protein [Noviherbaspirillum galbum]NEX63176.1 superoxide dismutase family protein [Noviherbaspirillum galbum]